MPSFEDMFKHYFDNQNSLPNPFDQEAFSHFINEAIKDSFANQSEHQSQDRSWDFANPFNKTQFNGSGSKFAGQNQSSSNKSHGIRHNIFETHDHIIVRITVDQTTNTELPQAIYLNSYELLIKDHDSKDPMYHIHLPKPISANHTRVDFRNDILEISMLKKGQEPFTEIIISDVIQ